MPQTKRCKCGTEMVMAVTPAGAAAPIVAAPSEDGNVLLLKPSGFASPLAVTLSKKALEDARAAGVYLRLNHFADCPSREEFKR